MFFAAILVVTVLSAAEAATTMPPKTTQLPPKTTQLPPKTTTMAMTTMIPAKVLLDIKHEKAMIVRADGCYEYQMSHSDVQAAQYAFIRTIVEARMLEELSVMVNRQEIDHHSIDNMTQEIRTACASLTVYSFTSS